jgi:hypothetical protein
MLVLLIIGPLFSASQLFVEMSEAERQFPALQKSTEWDSYKALSWWTYLVLAVVSIYGGWGLARGRDWSVVTRAKFVLWIIGPLGAVLMVTLVPFVAFGKFGDMTDGKFIGSLIASVIITLIWTLYLSVSKRVRATYGRDNIAF